MVSFTSLPLYPQEITPVPLNKRLGEIYRGGGGGVEEREKSMELCLRLKNKFYIRSKHLSFYYLEENTHCLSITKPNIEMLFGATL